MNSVNYRKVNKDTTVSLWVDFEKFYVEEPPREVCNGDFVIVNEDHQEEFDKFKDKVFTILALSPTSAPRVIN